MLRDLADPELFGNEAGEDEDAEVLASYFLQKPEFHRFYESRNRLGFVRSRKGMGKSALLTYTRYERDKKDPSEIKIFVRASDLFALQTINATTPSEMIYAWQQRICTRINLELGAALKIAFTDDNILLVESAELSNFRSRNLISALVDRLKLKGLGAEIERQRPGVDNSHALLSRVLEKKDITVWLFVDDVDATFINTEVERLKVSTFFSACRSLISSVSGLCIRASVRTDVWSILAQYDEAMDKCEQYMLDLHWSTDETGRMIENKILSYLLRYYPDDARFVSWRNSNNRAAIRRFVFKEPFEWSGRPLESFRPIHILSAGRPRWAAQLCKLAGNIAFQNHANLITIGHLKAVLKNYGQFRISDLYKEHRHQCARLEEIIESFSGGRRRFNTDQLLTHITEKVVRRNGIPVIDGIPAANGSRTVAHFLYRVGFITGRDEEDKAGLSFVKFEDRPNLLSTNVNLDDSHSWEVHPSYRDALRIQPAQDSSY